MYVDRYSPIMWIDTALLCTRYAKQEQELYRHIRRRSRLDTFGIRVGGLQVPKEEEDPVRYLPLLLGLAALRLLRCVLGTGVGAGAQVALDLALVDEVVVVAFPDDPDAQSVSVASVLHDEDVLPGLGALRRRRVEGRGVGSPSALEEPAPQLVVAGQRVPLPADLGSGGEGLVIEEVEDLEAQLRRQHVH